MNAAKSPPSEPRKRRAKKGIPHPAQSSVPGHDASERPASAVPEWASPEQGAGPVAASDPQSLGIYVHFPWCMSKCPYCDFLSVASDVIPSKAYADAIIREIERRRPQVEERHIHSIFIGGGTPSLWDSRQLGRVLDTLQRSFSLTADCEITAEANPSSLDLSKARSLHAAGINRLSIGVQSLRSERLRFLGRRHDPVQAKRAIEASLASGVPRVSADLMFGLPGQPAEESVEDATELTGLGIEHLSAYSLTIEPGTPFGARARQGTLPIAVDDEVANAFISLRDELLRGGYEHYEISNYARPGGRSRHNLGYWTGRDYLGLGCAAWGTLSSHERVWRYRNTPSPERYLDAATRWTEDDLDCAGQGHGQSELEVLSPETRFIEQLMLGLRLIEGIDIQSARCRLGLELWSGARQATYRRLLVEGLLEYHDPRTRIAPSHWIVSDSIVAQLV